MLMISTQVILPQHEAHDKAPLTIWEIVVRVQGDLSKSRSQTLNRKPVEDYTLQCWYMFNMEVARLQTITNRC